MYSRGLTSQMVDRENWLEALTHYCERAPLTCQDYQFLADMFQRSVRARPEMVEVHFNFVRYQMARTQCRKARDRIDPALQWIRAQVERPGFDWTNLIMQFRVLAEEECR